MYLKYFTKYIFVSKHHSWQSTVHLFGVYELLLSLLSFENAVLILLYSHHIMSSCSLMILSRYLFEVQLLLIYPSMVRHIAQTSRVVHSPCSQGKWFILLFVGNKRTFQFYATDWQYLSKAFALLILVYYFSFRFFIFHTI